MAAGKNSKIRRDTYLLSTNDNPKIGIVFFSISVLLHGLLFFSLVLFQHFKSPKQMLPAIQVDLVSFMPDPIFDEPIQPVSDSNSDGVPIKAKPEKKHKAEIKNIKPDISLKKKPANLKELLAKSQKKKPPVKKTKVKAKKETPVKKPDKSEDTESIKNEQENQDQIALALSRLQKDIKDRAKSKTSGNAGATKKGFKPVDIYNLIIESSINQNWVYNEIMAGMDEKLEVRIIIKILKNGEIRDIFYETRSGNRYLDESAKRAIKKSNPLPQLPKGMPSYDLGLIFTPRGLR